VALLWKILSLSRHRREHAYIETSMYLVVAHRQRPLGYVNQWGTERGGWSVLTPSPPKFRRPSKIVPNSTRFVKTVKNC